MLTVLCVADEPWVRNTVHAALSSSEYRVLDHDDPDTAADVVLDRRPDVVVADLQIGTMGGMAVTRAIRDAVILERAPRPAVVMLLDRPADAFLARRAGAASWIVKPFGPGELRRAIAGAREAVASAIAGASPQD